MTCGKSTELCLSVQIQQPNTEPGASGPAAGSGTTDTADVQWEPLPTARTLLDEPAVVPGDDHSYSLPPNTAGQAEHLQRRWRPRSDPVWRILVPAPAVEPTHVTASDTTTTAVPPTSQPVSYQVSDTELALHVSVSVDISTASLPLMTAWRHKRKLEKGIAAVYKKHKVYSCKKCGQTNTASTGHSKRSGFVYCPNLGKTKGRMGGLN